jgi:MFS family permease
MQAVTTRNLSAQWRTRSEEVAGEDRWLYSYAIFNACAMGVDGLIVIFATVVLAASPAMISVVDVMDTVGVVLAGAFIGRVVDRFSRHRLLLILLFLLVALSAALFAVVGGVWMAIGLSLLFGFFIGAPNPVATVLVTRRYQRYRWAMKFGAFNRYFYLGGGLGLAFGVVWLASLSHITDQDLAMRLLFPVLGALAALAAVTLPLWLKEASPERQDPIPLSLSEQAIKGSSLLGDFVVFLLQAFWSARAFAVRLPLVVGRLLMSIPVSLVETQRFFRAAPFALGSYSSETSDLLSSLWGDYHRVRQRGRRERETRDQEPFEDSLLLYYAATLVLFVAFGMGTTILPVFVTRQLGASSAVALATTASFLTTSTLAYNTLAKQMDHLQPLRMQAIATVARGTAFLALGFMGLLALPLPVSLVLVLALVTLSGVAWAAVTIAAVTRTVQLAPFRRRGEAVGIYQAVSYGGMVLGTLAGGALAQEVGFVSVFWVAAGLSFAALMLFLKF